MAIDHAGRVRTAGVIRYYNTSEMLGITHYSDQQTVEHSVQQPGRSLLFSTEQSTANKRRLDRECCLSHLAASFDESWDRDPGALS